MENTLRELSIVMNNLRAVSPQPFLHTLRQKKPEITCLHRAHVPCAGTRTDTDGSRFREFAGQIPGAFSPGKVQAVRKRDPSSIFYIKEKL